jgi:hypothetical protein
MTTINCTDELYMTEFLFIIDVWSLQNAELRDFYFKIYLIIPWDFLFFNLKRAYFFKLLYDVDYNIITSL